ncbi:DUF6516 family protein [Pseudomonas sp. HR96]|uniref:toxin-antitoxin system TumE family protein n=1 Tax=Pseudomonas sp. HR96 TaxID=1027966 RepID=UPI002A766C98|nr:DUF6516 family protein [Pseudomonas sp. HR96]WPO97567.1 DUF6516 family protein [Pseudomonas sp. HR96]
MTGVRRRLGQFDTPAATGRPRWAAQKLLFETSGHEMPGGQSWVFKTACGSLDTSSTGALQMAKGMAQRDKDGRKISERHAPPERRGNGNLRIEAVWDSSGKLVTYSFAYINSRVYSGDNGRVLGYDNAHGEHHRHVMGEYQLVEFESFEKTMELFQEQWQTYLRSKEGQ